LAQEKDIVLIYLEDMPQAFARIEEIAADIKPDWYQVKLLMLQVPLQVVTWILRAPYINGTDFTMGGKRVRLEQVVCPEDDTLQDTRDSGESSRDRSDKSDGAKVIPLTRPEEE
jgi:hypothetical protein